MKQYKMATIPNPSITKQPLKLVEVPLNKFSEEVVPYHKKLLEDHKAFVHKLIALNNLTDLGKEIQANKRLVKQLRDLLYELDTLRAQIEDADLDSFDSRTMPIRHAILKLTKGYQELEKKADKILSSTSLPQEVTSPKGSRNPFEGAPAIQCQANLQLLKLQEDEQRLHRLEELKRNTKDLHEIHRELHVLVNNQEAQVTEVCNSVTSTDENVNQGTKYLVQANKLSAVTYPATGAVVGTLLGGPLGLFLGLKIGGIAAVSGAVAGYVGGKFLKKRKEVEVNETEYVLNNENNENHTTVAEDTKKQM